MVKSPGLMISITVWYEIKPRHFGRGDWSYSKSRSYLVPERECLTAAARIWRRGRAKRIALPMLVLPSGGGGWFWEREPNE